MKTPKEQAATIGIMAICAVLGGFWVKGQPNIDEESKGDNPPLLVLENARAYRFDELGKNSLSLNSPKTVHYQDDRGTQFTKPNLLSFNNKLGADNLSADFALENKERTQITMEGNVLGISPTKKGNNELRTAKAIYFINEQKAVSQVEVEIKTPESFTTAIGAEWFFNTKLFQLKKDVRTRYEKK